MAKKNELLLSAEDAVQLLDALGFEGAGELCLSEKKLTKAINTDLAKLFKKNGDDLDKDAKKAVKQLLEADSIVIGEADEEEEEEKEDKKSKKKEKPAKKGKGKSKDDDEDEEEDEKPKKKKKSKKDDDEEDDEDDKKSKKKKKKGGVEKVGIIDTIIEILEGASKDSPISQAAILKKLVKKFPDREEDAMKMTVRCQVGFQLRAKKGLNIMKTDDGYYIGKKKKK